MGSARPHAVHILVVDDDHDLRHTICDFLDARGYKITQAANGRHAMVLMGHERPALVITDILMPEQEGISTIMEIRKNFAGTKIIAMSGGGRFRRFDLLKSARALGADAAIAKPFEFEELENTVSRLLGETDGGDGIARLPGYLRTADQSRVDG